MTFFLALYFIPHFFQISVFATIKEDSSLQKSSLDSRVESSLRRSSLESARVRQKACRFSSLESRVESLETRLGTSLISSRACGLAGSGSARIHPYSKDGTALNSVAGLAKFSPKCEKWRNFKAPGEFLELFFRHSILAKFGEIHKKIEFRKFSCNKEK